MRVGNLQVLTSNRDASLAQACNDNVVYEARKRGDAADEEGNNSTPICGVLWGVAIDTMKVVHVWYRDIATSDDEVTARHDRISKHTHCK